MILRRNPAAALKLSEECIAIAGEQGFPHWLSKATVYRGWALAQLGNADDGIEQIQQGIAGWRAAGNNIALAWHFALLAESQLAAAHAELALKSADEALTWVDRNTEHQWEPLVRVSRGDAFCALNELQRGHAEYETAVSVARRQEAKWWELRASTRLAMLWRDQGRRAEARDLLAPIYGWFTQGFDLPDLKDARALLMS